MYWYTTIHLLAALVSGASQWRRRGWGTGSAGRGRSGSKCEGFTCTFAPGRVWSCRSRKLSQGTSGTSFFRPAHSHHGEKAYKEEADIKNKSQGYYGLLRWAKCPNSHPHTRQSRACPMSFLTCLDIETETGRKEVVMARGHKRIPQIPDTLTSPKCSLLLSLCTVLTFWITFQANPGTRTEKMPWPLTARLLTCSEAMKTSASPVSA